jgi:hypothetical protein
MGHCTPAVHVTLFACLPILLLQVACGLNFTVALTRNGEVLQMGRTGAENNREHNAMWEVSGGCFCSLVQAGRY